MKNPHTLGPSLNNLVENGRTDTDVCLPLLREPIPMTETRVGGLPKARYLSYRSESKPDHCYAQPPSTEFPGQLLPWGENSWENISLWHKSSKPPPLSSLSGNSGLGILGTISPHYPHRSPAPSHFNLVLCRANVTSNPLFSM